MSAGGSQSAIVPWRMWGETKTVNVQSSGGLVTFNNDQFARINYGRPESWCFCLAAKLVAQSGQLIDGTVLTVHYDLTIGVGRSSVTIPDWHIFTFDYGGVAKTLLVGQMLWTNTVANRVASQGVPGPSPPDTETVNYAATSWIDTFVSQDIQLQVRVGLDSAGEATTASVDCSAYFAPKTHIRPEWFEAIGRFSGEQSAT
jgi:hypothetical protein